MKTEIKGDNMTAKHTPGPWTLIPASMHHHGRGISTYLGANVNDAENEHAVCVCPPGKHSSPEQWSANAQFIVTACNSHEEFLALAHNVTALDLSDEGNGPVAKVLIERARAVIAKAKQ